MRTTALAAALASLVLVLPAAAHTTNQATPRQPEARSPGSPDVFVAVLSGAYEVPAVETRASGTAELTLAKSRLDYQVHVNSIRDVTGVYIHIGRSGQQRPAVVDLFQGLKRGPVSGLLTRGTLRTADLHDEITMGKLVRALKRNDTYITVHTLSRPGGVLRGQLRIQPVVASR